MGASSATIEQLAHDIVEIRNPETALRALTALRQELETMEPSLVQQALRAGSSWSQIARALGVSKQAAHHKYRHLSDRALTDATSGSKILVTGEARQSIQFARQEAKRLGHQAIGTEHILLGILRCNRSHAVKALTALGVTHRIAVECLRTTLPGLPPDEQQAADLRRDGVSAHARRIMEGSLREALNRGDGYIGVEHLLLALLTDSRNGAVQTLEMLNATPTRIKSQLELEWQAISDSAEVRAAEEPALAVGDAPTAAPVPARRKPRSPSRRQRPPAAA
jgi:ATP-dependent Clp protease ATP-binding subunit ClpA